MEDFQSRGTQGALAKPGRGSLAKYRDVMVGDSGFFAFLRYELITSLFGSWPGGLGLALRRLFYPHLLRSCGRGVVFGRNLVLRHPHRISMGDGVIIDADCVLDAKGTEGDGIRIGNHVFLGRGTIVTMAGGTIVLDDGCNIGSACRIGSFGHTRIGKKALLGAYCYIVGAYHETTRTDIPILDQPNRTKGGAQVGDGCWLGARVTVMDGCAIGADSIVGAHAVVTRDLPALCVAAGIPARILRMRT